MCSLNKSFNRILILFVVSILYICFIASSYAAPIEGELVIEVTESGKIVDYYEEYYIVQVEGRITLDNKYPIGLPELFMQFELGTLTFIEKGGTDYIKDNYIEIEQIDAGEMLTIDYEIRGITAENPSVDNRSVMRTALGDFNTLYPLLVSEVEKVNFEGGDANNTRVVAIRITNPTPFDYNVSNLALIKTSGQDPNNVLDKWTFNNGNVTVPAKGVWDTDVKDTNSYDGEVYWITYDTDVILAERVRGQHQIRFFTEEDIMSVQNDSINEEELEDIVDYIEHFMFVKKSASTRVAIPGEIMTIKLQVSNFAPIPRAIALKDYIPVGFELFESNANAATNDTLEWSSIVSKDSTEIFEYDLKYVDKDLVGIDYFEPAELVYGNNTIYTERVPFVRQYVPEKKVYIQKKIRYSVNDELLVTLSVQNVGDSDLEDVYIKEFLADSDVFREISVNPEKKGVWLVDRIKRGDSWQVSYITNENTALSKLPEVYGVDNKVVLKTLVFENSVTNSWTDGVVDNMEKIGLIALFVFPLVVIFLVNYTKLKKKFLEKL